MFVLTRRSRARRPRHLLMSETADERTKHGSNVNGARWPRRARTMCKRLGDVPPAGRDTHVYYGHRAAVVLPGKIGSRRRRRRRRWRRGCLVQCNMCAAHRKRDTRRHDDGHRSHRLGEFIMILLTALTRVTYYRRASGGRHKLV